MFEALAPEHIRNSQVQPTTSGKLLERMLTTQIVFPSSYITHKQKQQYVLYHDMFAMRPKQDAMSQWLNDCQSSLDDRWRNWCEIARVPLTFFSMVAGLTYLCYRKWNFQHGRQQHDDDGASETSQEVYAKITNDIRVRNGAENLEMEILAQWKNKLRAMSLPTIQMMLFGFRCAPLLH